MFQESSTSEANMHSDRSNGKIYTEANSLLAHKRVLRQEGFPRLIIKLWDSIDVCAQQIGVEYL